jgi:Dolichyl-phosphate-mannose-protein mannosyltransferase
MPTTAEHVLEIASPDTAAIPTEQLAPAPQRANLGVAPHASRRRAAAALLVVWTLSIAWLGLFLRDNWVPHDDGMLAESAERVLQGQLPHRDFDEVYTGGLSYLHAAAFKLFGTNLFSIRLMLLVFFAAWVPVLFYCASRFIGPLGAALVTFLGVAWSVPVYPTGMPSWYCLFFATFGVAALLRHLETRARIWLFAAGLCGGFSFLVKSPGLYFIAAALLFFVFREQTVTRLASGADVPLAQPPRGLYSAFVRLSIFAFVVALVVLIRRLADLPELYNFVLPGFALAFVLLRRESQPAPSSDGERFRNLFRMAIPFLIGAALPVALFLIPYAKAHALRSFYYGVFVVPFMRVSMAMYRPPRLYMVLALVPIAGLLAFACYSKRRESTAAGVAALAGFVAVLIASEHSNFVYRFAWHSAATAIPVLIVAGALLLLRGGAGWKLTELRRQQLFLILSATALCSLIQFPYSSATYFCYVAPLAALAALAILSTRDPAPRLLPKLAAGFYIVFMMLVVTPGFGLDFMSRWYWGAGAVVPLEIPRAGILRVNSNEAYVYDRLIALVRQKATNGAVYAGPDSPEIYFLTGMRDPMRTIFDGFEDYAHESSRVLAAIDATNPNVIVINRVPEVSTPLPGDLRQVMAERYPHKAFIGNFEVRWRP